MRKFLLLAALLASTSAHAADVVVKAKPAVFDFTTSGWYVGVEAGAAVAQSNLNGSSLFINAAASGNLYAAGGTIGGCVGYIKGHAKSWYGLHACVDYQNITAGANVQGVDAGVVSRWSATQEFRIGGNPLTWLMTVLPNIGVTGLTFPTFTPPSVNGNLNLAVAPHSYFAVGVTEFGISGNFGQAQGAKIGVAPMIKMGAIWQSLGPTGTPNGGAVDVFAQVTFADRGMTFDNVFAPNGTLVASGGTDMGRTYKAGVGYYFSAY